MKNIDQNRLDDDRIGYLLFKLSLPAFIGMFVMTVYNIVDTIFIGHFVGPLGIAALSIVFPIQMLSMGMGLMMGIGGASVISRMIGARNIQRAEHAMGNAKSGTLILTAIIMVFGLIKADDCLRILGASETILPYAKDYLRIILIGMLFQSFAMAINAFIRAEGKHCRDKSPFICARSKSSVDDSCNFGGWLNFRIFSCHPILMIVIRIS